MQQLLHAAGATAHAIRGVQVAADAGDADAMYCLASLLQGHRGLHDDSAGAGTIRAGWASATGLGGTQAAPLPLTGDLEQYFYKAAEKGASRPKPRLCPVPTYWVASSLFSIT